MQDPIRLDNFVFIDCNGQLKINVYRIIKSQLAFVFQIQIKSSITLWFDAWVNILPNAGAGGGGHDKLFWGNSVR